mgnify:CR=1 FL=1
MDRGTEQLEEELTTDALVENIRKLNYIVSLLEEDIPKFEERFALFKENYIDLNNKN